jgi:hypothetical protein
MYLTCAQSNAARANKPNGCQLKNLSGFATHVALTAVLILLLRDAALAGFGSGGMRLWR